MTTRLRAAALSLPREAVEADEREAFGESFTPSLAAPYRWRDWAAPGGTKRRELAEGALGAAKGFVDRELLPHLRGLRDRPNATARQKVIAEAVRGGGVASDARVSRNARQADGRCRRAYPLRKTHTGTDAESSGL